MGRIEEHLKTVADCSYGVSVAWTDDWDDRYPNIGTAVAISDHFLLTCAHLLYWDEEKLGPADINVKYS